MHRYRRKRHKTVTNTTKHSGTWRLFPGRPGRLYENLLPAWVLGPRSCQRTATEREPGICEGCVALMHVVSTTSALQAATTCHTLPHLALCVASASTGALSRAQAPTESRLQQLGLAYLRFTKNDLDVSETWPQGIWKANWHPLLPRWPRWGGRW